MDSGSLTGVITTRWFNKLWLSLALGKPNKPETLSRLGCFRGREMSNLPLIGSERRQNQPSCVLYLKARENCRSRSRGGFPRTLGKGEKSWSIWQMKKRFPHRCSCSANLEKHFITAQVHVYRQELQREVLGFLTAQTHLEEWMLNKYIVQWERNKWPLETLMGCFAGPEMSAYLIIDLSITFPHEDLQLNSRQLR